MPDTSFPGASSRGGLAAPPHGIPGPRPGQHDRLAGAGRPARPVRHRPPRPGQPPRQVRRKLAGPARRAATACAWLAAGAFLYGCYLHISRTVPVDSDGAANALQAWDMLHGNLLLRGWRLSDVSFYTTELPEYMLIELARGLQPDVVHVAGAITFTLLVLLAAMLAKGRRRGREGAVRMGIAGLGDRRGLV